ncbi:MAG: DUF1801 domain-containing protein [Bacteroidetes bacterium]|nr:DUF1801 domain-containing protein [Bacteroidota bacterium]
MISSDINIDAFLSQYDEEVYNNAIILRELLLASLPKITEQIDLTAKMIAYCYGQKYSELICVIIPSKKGLKLGFNRGVQLADPDKLLEGTGRISRYIKIKSEAQIKSITIKKLIETALIAYKQCVQNNE